VLDIGLVSTPVLYHFAGSQTLPLGLMVSASHNPGHFNGLKLCQNGARPVGADQIHDLGVRARALVGRRPGTRTGRVTRVDPYPAYCTYVRSFARFEKRLRIAVDAANAVCGTVVPRVFAGLPIDVIPLYFEPDGTFPNHEPDPLKPENTRALQEAVVANGCAFGAALDGDGDRVIFIDERGGYVAADLATILIALDVVEQAPAGAKVVIDTRVTKAVADALAPRGVEVIRTRVGHSFLKKKIHEVGGIFGGELSGHYYFRESFFAENSDLAIISMVNLLSRSAQPLSALVAAHRRYFQSGEINFAVTDKADALARLRERYATAQQSFIDGVTLEYPTWWTNVRPSNTEDLLRLNVEAETKDEPSGASTSSRLRARARRHAALTRHRVDLDRDRALRPRDLLLPGRDGDAEDRRGPDAAARPHAAAEGGLRGVLSLADVGRRLRDHDRRLAVLPEGDRERAGLDRAARAGLRSGAPRALLRRLPARTAAGDGVGRDRVHDGGHRAARSQRRGRGARRRGRVVAGSPRGERRAPRRPWPARFRSGAPGLGVPLPVVLGFGAGVLIGLGALYTKGLFLSLEAGLPWLAWLVFLPFTLVANIAAVWVQQAGFQQGRALIVVAMNAVTNKVVSIVGGMAIVGELLPAEPGLAVARVVGFVAIIAGTVVLARFGGERIVTELEEAMVAERPS
jgi:phosphomannomutase